MGNTKLGYGFLSQVFLGLRMGGDILCRLNLEEIEVTLAWTKSFTWWCKKQAWEIGNVLGLPS